MLSGVVFADSGEVLWYVAANARGFDGSDSPHCWTGGFPYPVSCILIPMTASTPLIFSKSRMRRRARTDLCGGRSAMVVPTATKARILQRKASEFCGGRFRRQLLYEFAFVLDALAFPFLI